MGSANSGFLYPMVYTMEMKPPQILVNHLADGHPGFSPSFLHLRHMKLRLTYPDGTTSEDFFHDVVLRPKGADAVVICAYDRSNDQIRVWLRSCVRPAVSSRYPFPNSEGCGWELPAGLIDTGETPLESGIRELYEEVGFKVQELQQLGRPVWGSVGLAPECLHFYSVDVTGLNRDPPAEDGSPLERHGVCSLMSIREALHSGASTGDMKTDLGIHRLVAAIYGHDL